MAEYTVNEEAIEIVTDAITAFVDAVHRAEPETFYRAYRKGDSREFVHFMAFPDMRAQKLHQKASYTLNFVDVLYPNCEIQPEFTPLTEIPDD